MPSLLFEAPDPAPLRLRGLEPDNLLAILAALGLLRALDRKRPEWRARLSWGDLPWQAKLHLAEPAGEDEVAAAAAEGIEAIAACLDVDGRKNVDFDQGSYRRFVTEAMGADPAQAALAAALCAEFPEKRDGGLRAAPLVMMFGQGHQNFLERLMSVSRGEAGGKGKSAEGLRDPGRIKEALFAPWRRQDETDSFRWDPEEDQRYALRYRNPSKEGAATTVHGANRLAVLGLLSFVCAPSSRQQTAAGWSDGDFVWPIWTSPLTLRSIEALLTHREVMREQDGPEDKGKQKGRLGVLGVVEVYRAKRISNGKFMNVARARL